MALFALVPGLPFVPFMAGAAALGFAAWYVRRQDQRKAAEAAAKADEPAAAPRERSMGDVLDLDDIHVQFSPDLVEMALDPATGLDARIQNMRNHVATTFGLILPEIRLTDDASLPAGNYVVRVLGVEQARAKLVPGKVLALAGGNDADLPPGEDVKEPVYGAPARWVDADTQDDLALAGITVVNPTEVLATHLLEVMKTNFSRLLSLKALRRLLDEMTNLSDQQRSDANRRMIDELIPDKVPVDLLLAVLRLLLEERVSIRNLSLILEAISEARTATATPETIAEHVRQRLGFQLVAELRRTDGTVPLIQLAPEWEQTFATYQVEGGHGDVALPPDIFNKLAGSVADRLARAGEAGIYPAVVTSVRRRRFVRTVLAAKGIGNPVMSFEELGAEARPSLVGLVAA